MKKISQTSKKLNFHKKVIMILSDNEKRRIHAGSYTEGDSICACRSAAPGEVCPSKDCTTAPTGTCTVPTKE